MILLNMRDLFFKTLNGVIPFTFQKETIVNCYLKPIKLHQMF